MNLNSNNWATDIFPRQRRDSLYATVNQDVAPGVNIYADGQYSHRFFIKEMGTLYTPIVVPASNPFFVDPYHQGYTVLGYDFGRDFGPTVGRGTVDSTAAVLGANIDLIGDWQLRSYGSFSKERSVRITNDVDQIKLSAALADPNPATAFNPFGDGAFTNPATLNSLRTTDRSITDSWVWSGNATVDGTLFTLPGGDAKLAVGGDYRGEHYNGYDYSGNYGVQQLKDYQRNVYAAFGELVVPIIGRDNALWGVRKLTFSAAGRYEDYQDKSLQSTGDITRNPGSSTNPKLGLDWMPIDDLTLRGSYGTSFRAPNLPTIGGVEYPGILAISDPKSPTGTSTVLIRTGSSNTLTNETSTSWTAGVDYQPHAIPNLDIGVTYFNIDFKNRITSPASPGNILVQEADYSSIIIRSPTQAQINAICANPNFFGNRASCVQGGIAAIIDDRLQNAERSSAQGLDLNLKYGFDTARGDRFDFSINGSYMMDFSESFGSSSVAHNLVSMVHYPVDFSMRDSVTWTGKEGLSVSGYLNFTNGYTDNVSIPYRSIDAYTTIDLTISYDTRDRLAGLLLNDSTIALSVQNLFDSDPPFVNNTLGIGYDPENADPRGRFISFSIAKKW